MNLRILASAWTDLEEGFQFYEFQQVGLGDYFIASMKADVESLRISAGIHPLKCQDYHRMLCRVFPFAIYYTKIGPDVTVYAIIDCWRNPTWVRRRLAR
jgi:hypothetical protein